MYQRQRQSLICFDCHKPLKMSMANFTHKAILTNLIPKVFGKNWVRLMWWFDLIWNNLARAEMLFANMVFRALLVIANALMYHLTVILLIFFSEFAWLEIWNRNGTANRVIWAPTKKFKPNLIKTICSDYSTLRKLQIKYHTMWLNAILL